MKKKHWFTQKIMKEEIAEKGSLLGNFRNTAIHKIVIDVYWKTKM